MISTLSRLTFSKTGLLLLTSSTPTITCAVEDRAWGPPEALSSAAVMLRTYSTPWRWGGGLERSRIKPADKRDRSIGSGGWTISRDTSVLHLCLSRSSRLDDRSMHWPRKRGYCVMCGAMFRWPGWCELLKYLFLLFFCCFERDGNAKHCSI